MSGKIIEKRKKRFYYATDSEYRLICDCARIQGRSQSAQVLISSLAEVNRHVPKKGLIELLEPLVESIITKYLKDILPAPGNRAGKDLKRDLGCISS